VLCIWKKLTGLASIDFEVGIMYSFINSGDYISAREPHASCSCHRRHSCQVPL